MVTVNSAIQGARRRHVQLSTAHLLVQQHNFDIAMIDMSSLLAVHPGSNTLAAAALLVT